MKICRWDWCGKAFHSVPELIEHVSEAHVRTCSPIPYGDYLILREREEREAAGQSISTGIISFETEKLTQDSAPAGSLPSPPATSDVEDDPVSNHGGNDSDIYQPQIDSRSHSPPTFGSLSSPTPTPEPLSIPDSPNFDQLVANAIRGTKRQLDVSQCSNNSQSSQESTQSQDLVVQQLTQYESDDELDDSGRRPMKTKEENAVDAYTLNAAHWSAISAQNQHPTPAHQSSPKPIRTYGRSSRQSSNTPQIPSQPVSPLKYRFDPMPQFQQWYSVDPRSLHDDSGSESVDSSRLTTSSWSESYQRKKAHGDNLVDLDIGDDHESQENFSYPIMTQAPYHSQPYSQ